MNQRRLHVISVVIVNVCRLIIAVVGLKWLAEDNGLWSIIAAAAFTLTLLPGWLLRSLLLRDATNIVVAILLAAHIMLGMHCALYETSVFYDTWMHALGSGAITVLLIIAALGYCGRHRVELPLMLFTALTVGGTVSAGTLWELFEFAVDLTGLVAAQRGLHDTMLDLLADTAGAVTVAAAFAASVSLRQARSARNETLERMGQAPG